VCACVLAREKERESERKREREREKGRERQRQRQRERHRERERERERERKRERELHSKSFRLNFESRTASHDVSRTPHSNASHLIRGLMSFFSVGMCAGMEWLPLVGSVKLQVSFAEYSTFYMAVLQKRPIVLRSLLIVATP